MIVDGVRYTRAQLEAEMPDVAPERIESIEVVKGDEAVRRFGTAPGETVAIIYTRRP